MIGRLHIENPPEKRLLFSSDLADRSGRLQLAFCSESTIFPTSRPFGAETMAML
jgi:hypothetical protein